MKKKTCSFRAGLAVALSVASLTSGAVLAGAAPASVALAASGISESKARMIALKDAGFSSHQVLGLDTDDDKQDGKKIYEVVFFKKTGDRKYDKYRYVIAYKDGKILKHSKRDIRIITKQQALHEALYKKHFSRSQVYDVDVEWDDRQRGGLHFERRGQRRPEPRL